MAEGEILVSQGWCAPSASSMSLYMDIFDPVGISLWPPGLTETDLAWLAEMLHAAEIDPQPYDTTPFPIFQIPRGGIRFPTPGEVTDEPA